jgi:hypothetical protein
MVLTMRPLYCGIAIALFSAHNAHSGTIDFSPSVSIEAFQTKVKSENSGLQRNDTIIKTTATADVDYKSDRLTSIFTPTAIQRFHKDEKESSESYIDWRWKSSLEVLSERFFLVYGWDRYHKLFDTIRGGFEDDLYSVNQGDKIIQHKKELGGIFDAPENSTLDGKIEYYAAEFDITNYEDQYSENQRENNTKDNKYRSDRGSLTLGQYTMARPIFWRVDGSYLNERRPEQQGSFNNWEYSFITRTRLYERLHFAGISNSSRYKNANGWRYGKAGEPISYHIAGAGLAWVKHQTDAFFQLTYNKEVVNSDEETTPGSLGAEFRWKFSERWQISARRIKKFYGQSYDGELAYFGTNSTFTAKYNERVELSYMLGLDRYINGIYICPNTFTKDSIKSGHCILPTDGNYLIEPGFVFVPNWDVSFPLETRLTLRKEFELDWVFEKGRWTHRLSVLKDISDDLEYDYASTTKQAYFEGDWRLSNTYYLRTILRYRDSILLSSGIPSVFSSVDRLYSVGFHHQLNTRAEWSISLQLANKTSIEHSFDYDDSRVVLGYTHHFGVKNINTKEMFPDLGHGNKKYIRGW